MCKYVAILNIKHDSHFSYHCKCHNLLYFTSCFETSGHRLTTQNTAAINISEVTLLPGSGYVAISRKTSCDHVNS